MLKMSIEEAFDAVYRGLLDDIYATISPFSCFEHINYVSVAAVGIATGIHIDLSITKNPENTFHRDEFFSFFSGMLLDRLVDGASSCAHARKFLHKAPFLKTKLMYQGFNNSATILNDALDSPEFAAIFSGDEPCFEHL